MADTLHWPVRALSAGFVLHNAEEMAGDFPGWIARFLPMSPASDAALVGPAVVIMSLAVIGLGEWALAKPGTLSLTLFQIVAGALALNGLSHAVLSLATATLAPGTITGLVLLLPLGGWLFRRIGRDRGLQPRGWAVCAVAAALLNPIAVVAGLGVARLSGVAA